MAGDVDKKEYGQIEKSRFFNVLSRLSVFNYLKNDDRYIPIQNIDKLQSFINGNLDNKIVLINTSENFGISGNKLKEVLSSFFF